MSATFFLTNMGADQIADFVGGASLAEGEGVVENLTLLQREFLAQVAQLGG